MDAYRAAAFREEIRGHAGHGKPVAVTEFGTCACQGAALRGGMAWTVPERAVPDEGEQVRYFTELLDVFEEEGVDSAFWFAFAGYGRPGARPRFLRRPEAARRDQMAAEGGLPRHGARYAGQAVVTDPLG